ncbi:hypothetical protein DMX86_02240 [Cutibacterium acnes]|nr:hypothetical protein FD539_02245 [Cutibacterium acnes]TMT81310.1 hypothetical protein DMX86_02240 [Cutibacterium acnes]
MRRDGGAGGFVSCADDEPSKALETSRFGTQGRFQPDFHSDDALARHRNAHYREAGWQGLDEALWKGPRRARTHGGATGERTLITGFHHASWWTTVDA